MRTFILFIAVMILCYGSIAQLPAAKVFDIKNLIPTSPEMAILGRFADIPVGYYTGTADISIPLYTIRDNGIEVPIVMRYHSSGIKVQDEASWVGLGWSLEPAGAIIQTILGREDGLDHIAEHPLDGYNFLKENMTPYTYGGKYTSEIPSALSNVLLFGDGQPDLYYFNFPGFSGKFFINPETNEFVQLDKKVHLKIVKHSFSSWSITTLGGNVFYFSAMETANGVAPSDVTGRTWKLSKIQLSNGREINFNYSEGTYHSYTHSETWHDDYPLGYGGGGFQNFTNLAQHSIKYLRSIEGANVKVEFELEDRDDLMGQADMDNLSGNGVLSTKRLNKVFIRESSSNELLRSFDFSYGYFGYNLTGGHFGSTEPSVDYSKQGKRLKLHSVMEYGYGENDQAVPGNPYTFAYEEAIELPLKTSAATDFWGYYNGKNNTKLLPDLSYYQFSGYPEYQNFPPYVLSSYGTGANRSVNTNTIQAGVLKRINYPTGGHTIFQYESNSFSNYNYPDVDQIAASTINLNVEDKNNSNDSRSRQFTIPNTLTVHFSINLNRGPNTAISFADMLPSSVTLTRIGAGGSNITPIKTWQMQSTQAYGSDFTADGIVSWNEDIILEYIPNTYYVLIANLPDNLGPQNSSNNSASVSANYNFSYMINTNSKLSNGGGVRIKSIANYMDENTLSSKKTLMYTINGQSSGVLMSPLRHFMPRDMYFRKIITIPISPYKVLQQADQKIWFVSAESFVPFSNAASGNLVGYTRVQEIEQETTGLNGYHNYYYFNNESSTSMGQPDNPDVRNGSLWREEILNSGLDTLKKVEYHYQLKDEKFFLGFKAVENFVGWEEVLAMDPISAETYWPMGKRFKIDSYPNNARWYVLNKKINTDFFALKKIKLDEEYQYNSLGQMTSQKNMDSEGNLTETNIVYLNDEPTSGNNLLQVMKDFHLYSSILRKNDYLNGNLIYSLRNNYGFFNTYPYQYPYPLLQSTEVANTGTDFKQEILFNSYGDFQTPIEINKNGQKTTLLWSYNSRYPVVQILNSSLAGVTAAAASTNLTDFSRIQYPGNGDVSGLASSLRAHSLMKDAHITTYTHKPLVGMTSMTDAKGMMTFYDYDSFGRLKFIRDQDGNIIKQMDYHYKN